MSPILENYYEVLGVSEAADEISLRSAFRRLSKSLHPDTSSLPVEEAATKFQKICEAYEVLADPISRREYDAKLFKISKDLGEKNIFESSIRLKTTFIKIRGEEVRRPLSGGELFSLLMLCATLALSLIVGIIFALSQGREFQSVPSWLSIDPVPNDVNYIKDNKRF